MVGERQLVVGGDAQRARVLAQRRLLVAELKLRGDRGTARVTPMLLHTRQPCCRTRDSHVAAHVTPMTSM